MYNGHDPILMGTSLLFIIPATMAAYNREWIFYLTTLSVAITSLLTHSTKNPTIMIIDIFAVQALTWATVPYYYNNGIMHIWLIATGPGFILFSAGYLTDTFIYSSNKQESQNWHIIMHLCGITSLTLAQLHGIYSKKLLSA